MTKPTALLAAMVHEFMTNAPSMAEKYKLSCHSDFGFLQCPGRLYPFLTPKRLAEHLSISLKTLERMRKDGSGPPFIRLATKQIRYPIVELDRWVRETLTRQEQAESGPILKDSNIGEKL